MSITAFLGNTLILVALRKENSLHLPSKLLYRNLAVTDLCVGIIVEPLFVTYWMSLKTGRWDICYHVYAVARFAGYVLCGVSLLASTAISLDRLLALLLGLRYRQAVTLKKVYMSVFFMWVLSIVGTSSYFWSPDTSIPFLYTLLSFCLPTIIFSYIKLFFHSPSSPNSSSSGPRPSSTTGSSNSTEHNSIQKGGVQCIVGAGNIGCLLSALCRSSLDTPWKLRVFIIGLP